jgi:hypothetical protein
MGWDGMESEGAQVYHCLESLFSNLLFPLDSRSSPFLLPLSLLPPPLLPLQPLTPYPCLPRSFAFQNGLMFHEGRPCGADLKYIGPGNQRRGRADQFSKVGPGA